MGSEQQETPVEDRRPELHIIGRAGRVFFVTRSGEFDVIWSGAFSNDVGRTSAERAWNYRPRVIATCYRQEDAALISRLMRAYLVELSDIAAERHEGDEEET